MKTIRTTVVLLFSFVLLATSACGNDSKIALSEGYGIFYFEGRHIFGFSVDEMDFIEILDDIVAYQDFPDRTLLISESCLGDTSYFAFNKMNSLNSVVETSGLSEPLSKGDIYSRFKNVNFNYIIGPRREC